MAALKLGLHQDLGFQGTLATRQTQVAIAKTLRARVSRSSVLWDVIEATQGTYDWSRYDSLIAAVEAAGMTFLGTITGSPTWANAGADRQAVPGVGVDATFTTWQGRFTTFVTDLVNRYKPGGPAGTNVRTWELWNEENLATSWNNAGAPSVAQYVSWANAVRAAILAADPLAKVMVGGLASYRAASGASIAGQTFLASVLAGGLNAGFDTVALHPYPDTTLTAANQDPAYHDSGDTATNNAFDNVQRLLDDLQEKGKGAWRVWLTEFGWSTSGGTNPVSQAQQAQYITAAVRMIRQRWGHRVDGVVVFVDYDRTSSGFFHGLYDASFNPKPSAAAFAAARSPLRRAMKGGPGSHSLMRSPL